jgi:cell division protease FtsH
MTVHHATFDEGICRVIDEAHQRAANVLLDRQAALHEIAAILIEYETIDKEQFERLLHAEPEQNVLAHQPAPAQPTRKPQRQTRAQAAAEPGADSESGPRRSGRARRPT